ncbi:predicted protein [Plenodomus lingam JN3]|uniref:Predicted protein n=1 Tax=Leptosphaeria maculans (strain JN3 / isolate v23.1.3 / race Av1-4-5-6-7-8) TaxID=985895 RepID=E4ZMK1_LEPMJ|nr:predicted protein [Plenodomus lingam JN3]CBX92870.1 predicted protein [Plenodomus lingam JN3]
MDEGIKTKQQANSSVADTWLLVPSSTTPPHHLPQTSPSPSNHRPLSTLSLASYTSESTRVVVVVVVVVVVKAPFSSSKSPLAAAKVHLQDQHDPQIAHHSLDQRLDIDQFCRSDPPRGPKAPRGSAYGLVASV